MYQTKTNKTKILKVQLQKQKDTGKILVKDNVEMNSKIRIHTRNHIKAKGIRRKRKENELNEIKKEVDKINRENVQQTKNSNTEKENNIKTIKKLQEEKDTMENKNNRSKTLNLHLETNLHKQQNKDTQWTEQLAIIRKPTDRTDQDRERKEDKNK